MNKRVLSILCSFLIAILAFSLGAGQRNGNFDILIRNGKIVDGTGNPWFYGDVGIIGDAIVEMGNLAGKTAAKVIDAKGLVVAPGFIDLHTHCDNGLGTPGPNANANYITQGVTTVVVGNCGMGTFKISQTKGNWETQGIGTNAALLVGFGTLRKEVLGTENRLATPEEIEKMKSLLHQAMTEGAWGISTGLQYIPDRYAPTEEVIAVTKVVGEFGGIYTSHQRDEEAFLADAIKETIRIGNETGARVNAAHLKLAGKNNWGRMKDAIELVNEARAQGIDITADMYPYDKAAITPIIGIFNVPADVEPLASIVKKFEDQTLPAEEQQKLIQQATDELAIALADKNKREKIKKITLEGDPERVNWVKTWGWHNFTIVSAKKNTNLIGKIFWDLAREQKKDAFDIAADLFIQEKNDLIISLGAMSEKEMELAMKEDWLMFSSDGGTVYSPEGFVHPRFYGSFPRVLRRYVNEEKTLTLEQAVRKMTSLPARALQLKDRGLLLKGYKADIVVFDPEKVRDNATYLSPFQYSSGIQFVIVNGKMSVENGQFNKALNGKVLLH